MGYRKRLLLFPPDPFILNVFINTGISGTLTPHEVCALCHQCWGKLMRLPWWTKTNLRSEDQSTTNQTWIGKDACVEDLHSNCILARGTHCTILRRIYPDHRFQMLHCGVLCGKIRKTIWSWPTDNSVQGLVDARRLSSWCNAVRREPTTLWNAAEQRRPLQGALI